MAGLISFYIRLIHTHTEHIILMMVKGKAMTVGYIFAAEYRPRVCRTDIFIKNSIGLLVLVVWMGSVKILKINNIKVIPEIIALS